MSESKRVPTAAVKGAEALTVRMKQSKMFLTALQGMSETMDKNMGAIEKQFEEFNTRLSRIENFLDTRYGPDFWRER